MAIFAGICSLFFYCYARPRYTCVQNDHTHQNFCARWTLSHIQFYTIFASENMVNNRIKPMRSTTRVSTQKKRNEVKDHKFIAETKSLCWNICAHLSVSNTFNILTFRFLLFCFHWFIFFFAPAVDDILLMSIVDVIRALLTLWKLFFLLFAWDFI